MANIIQQIATLFKKVNPPEKSTRVDIEPIDNGSDAYIYKFKNERDRRTLLVEVVSMYKSDPRCKESLSTLGRDSVLKGFEVKSKNRRVQKIAKDLFDRLKIIKMLDDTVRLSSRDGDSFYEVVINEKLEIVDLSRKPTQYMYRNTNKADQFEDPNKAFSLKMSEWTEVGIDFPMWQMLHLRWNHDKENRYGTPQYAPAITAFNRMREGEIDLATRRKSNAGQKLLHFVDGDEADIERYKEINSDALLKPFRAITNFFTNRDGSIKVLQGDQNIGNIKDVQHHIDTWSTSSPVPLFLLGYGSDLNRDILEDQRDQYEKTLFSVTEWLNDEILQPLLDLQLLLMGIWPEDIEYEIEWLRYANTRQEKFEEASEMMKTVAIAADGVTKLSQIRSAETGLPLLADTFVVELIRESLTNILGDELMQKFKEYEVTEDTLVLPEVEQPTNENGNSSNGNGNSSNINTNEVIQYVNNIGRQSWQEQY